MRIVEKNIPIIFSSFIVLFLPSLISAGCYAPVRMCCRGRNNTCRSTDDGLRSLPESMGGPTTTTQRPWNPRFVTSSHNQDIGQLVRTANNNFDHAYNQYERDRNRHRTSSYKEYIFGDVVREKAQPEIVEEMKPKRHLLIRYEIVAEHLPLTVLETNQVEYDSGMKIMYLEAPPMSCFCDETCIELGDCCSDYTYVCPRRDCRVSEWSQWEGCKVDGDRKCGTGTQKRVRTVTQSSDHGGERCPALKEMRTCFKGCEKTGSSYEEETTVALLLDYKYNGTRSRHSKRHRWMTGLERANRTSYYCVEYKIGWVNRNCINPSITARLHRGNTICAECQPEAQVHRKSLRCASDLDDGDMGFWKLIGPQSCNGIWTRVTRIDNCRCSRDIPSVDPFLLV
ncbi:hypothetical protein PRIPAC_93202 [Pristionchus pacificus]|uniref:SMB domain-containing protein n=1 Tax=Pristionchus pacificus TaxID=54126 RepID=A0A2A6B4B3_PRIPA|nr:hypothetical protein PRIPAC_93202 [Pristionchus pacificus]|eukprot:PDM60701.1 hypothetical protein PRIPAC_53970 [Pristionchus pacificus]